jgi:hypothetical protein
MQVSYEIKLLEKNLPLMSLRGVKRRGNLSYLSFLDLENLSTFCHFRSRQGHSSADSGWNPDAGSAKGFEP